jgi:NitT/TauT family transport system permease protein
MRQSKHIHHEHHHFGFSYPISLAQRLYSIVLGPLLVVFAMVLVVKYFALQPGVEDVLSASDLFYATLATIGRIGIAYTAAILVAIPLALLVTYNPVVETILLPLFDILESIPILAFFPILILIFIRVDFLNGAALVILFLSMVWSIVFTLVGGLKIIPKDIHAAAKVFNVRGWTYFDKIIIPAIIPQLVTGSILAFASGWNIIIVAEVMHVYIPNGNQSQDLFGLGSILVHAAAESQNQVFFTVVVVMVLIIAFMNFFIWQKLLKYAQRFRFE